MNRAVIIALVAYLAMGALSGCRPDRIADRTLAARTDALLAPLVAAREFAGAVVLMRHGEIVYERGFGMANHAEGVAFTPDTPVDGASLAKTFTAAGVWWLVHEGRIDIDAPVVRYVAEYPHAETTVRQLLAHSNGLPPSYDFFAAHFDSGDVWTTQAMLQRVAVHAPRPAFVPGTWYEYSNLGYDAAGLLIERVTGLGYEAFVKERFFDPLGMRSSFARPAWFADWHGARTAGYQFRDGTWAPNDAIEGEAFLGASNLYFSARDLARWASAHAAGTALPAPVFAAGRVRPLVGGRSLAVDGLSWYCDDRGVRCNYTGHHAGFHDFAYWDSENDEAVAFVSNSTLPAWKIAMLQRALVGVLRGRVPDPEPDVSFVALRDVGAAALAGAYVAPGLEPVTLADGERGLTLRFGDGIEFNAYPAGHDVLYVPGLDWYVAFSLEAGALVMHVESLELNVVARRR